MLAALAFAASTIAAAGAHGEFVDINGGNSWGGWTKIGDAQTAGAWVQGSARRNYAVYSTMFTLETGQTVGGSRVADGDVGTGVGYTGDSEGSLFSGSWQAGDRIIGIGLQYSGTSYLSNMWVLVDWAGDSIRPATGVGAGDGVHGANAGDLAIYSIGNGGYERFRSKQYSVFTGQSDGSNNFITPYGMSATTSSPARSFAVLANGSTSAAVSAQYFVNLDAILRSNGGATYGDGALGPSTRIGFFEADSEWNFTQQVFSIPAPGVAAVAGLVLLAQPPNRSRRSR